MVNLMDVKKAMNLLIGMIAVAIFTYPIIKMTVSAIENNVNLYPVLMVFLSVILAAIISKIKK